MMVNLYCVYVAVGGIAFLVSAWSDRPGQAIAIVFALLLISFLFNFLAQFWGPAKQVAFLSVMQYYQPARILSSGDFPVRDVLILLAIGGTSWLLGCEILAAQHLHVVTGLLIACGVRWHGLLLSGSAADGRHGRANRVA